jgi:mannose-6-phosphate isomerase class I
MEIPTIPFHVTDWKTIEPTRHEGETGFALWKTIQLGHIRVREVQYSQNYRANHWCVKGHVLFCLEGEMTTELKDGRQFTLEKGTSYQVGDNMEAHRSFTKNGCRLFIVD